jgi:hypothetical protein
VRKYLTASLIACLASTTFVGCGEKTQEAQVSEQLEQLLDQMSRLQYADAPSEGNELVYTLGKEVNGVQVPGSTRFEAAYLDQALALLPLAQEIEAKGSDLQKQSANAIIGTIKADEASFLIDEAERSFQHGSKLVVDLRSKLAVLREISALNDSVAGDGAEQIAAYREGVNAGGFDLIGINGMQEKADEAAGIASKASADLAKYNEQISELRDKVSEYEALELKLTGQSRSSQSSDKFDKLDQATAAAKEAETAQAEAQSLEIDAWISERVANLAEFRRQQLDGKKGVETASLLGKLDGILSAAATQTNVSTSSDTYTNLTGMLAEAKQTSGDDAMKAAAFLLSMSDYGTAAAADLDQRSMLVKAADQLVLDEIGVIGLLEMKIAQIKVERQRVANKLAEIDADRKKVIEEFIADFASRDAMIQAAGFDRMAEAAATLKEAEQAYQGAGRKTDMDLMSVYTLHARVLHQQSVSARLYKTTLSSIAAAGPELLGTELHGAISGRANDMDTLLGQVAAGMLELEEAASGPLGSLGNTDAESDRGQIAARQIAVYDSLTNAVRQGGGGTPAPPTPGTPDTPDTPAAGGMDPALLGTWKQVITEIEGQPLPQPMVIQLTFNQDGVLGFNMNAPDGSKLVADGSYSAGNGKVVIKSPAELGGDEEPGTYEITGDTLKLVNDADGETIELTRVE